MIAWICRQAQRFRECGRPLWYVEFEQQTGKSLEPEALAYEIQRAQHHATARNWSLWAFGFGAFFSFWIAAGIGKEYSAINHIKYFAFAALTLLSVGAVGGLLGFLFGIPRTGTDRGNASDQPSATAAQSARSSEIEATRDDKRKISNSSINTNLEEVSDWLTKIILGAGLTQVGAIATGAWALSQKIGEFGFGDTNDNKTGAILAACLLVYGLIAGFLSIYVLTRIYLSGVFDLADRVSLGHTKIFNRIDENQELDKPKAPPPKSGPDDTVKQQEPTDDVKAIARIPLDELRNAKQLRTAGRAHYAMGDMLRAEDAYRRAISTDPSDIRSRLELGRVFIRSKRYRNAVDFFTEALSKLDAAKDGAVELTLRSDLAYAALFLAQPDGFTRALDALSKIDEVHMNPDLWIKRICANGQKYLYLKGSSQDAELIVIKSSILRDIEKVLTEDRQGWLEYLQALVDSDKRRSLSIEDDDLEAFKDDPEIRAILGLPSQPPAQSANPDGPPR